MVRDTVEYPEALALARGSLDVEILMTKDRFGGKMGFSKKV